MAYKILVVDDEKLIVKGIKFSLEQDGMDIDVAYDGEEALELIKKNDYDLAVLDVMLPKMDGLQVCREVREFSQMPIIMVTAKGEDMDKILGLEYGADDYMTKPADEEELLLRIGALLRRAQAISSRRLTVGNTTLIYDDLAVEWDGKITELPRKEFQLLYRLLSCPNKTFTRRQLMDEIWDLDTDSDEHTVNVHINRLRDRFKGNPDFAIVTVRGLGYKAVRV